MFEKPIYCARCGTRHASRKSKHGTTVSMQCPKCKFGYTVGAIDAFLVMRPWHRD